MIKRDPKWRSEATQAVTARPKYYEAHITLDTKFRGDATEIGQEYGFHWSQIDGDEVMGDGVKGYLTRSDTDGERLAQDLWDLCAHLVACDITYRRRKIEAVIFDERTKEEAQPA